MINLKKQDNVADAVNEILQQEALKGNQGAIDANHNGEVDSQDFKILRAKKKKVEEELKGNQGEIDANNNGKVDREDFKLLRAKKKMKEEVEVVYEANIEPTSAKSRTHIGNLSSPVVNSVVRSGKEIGLITKQPNGEFHAHHSAAKLAHSSSGTFDTKDKAHQFVRDAHAKAIKNGTLKASKMSEDKEEVEQIDELSINTLTRVKHAATSAASDASREGDEGKSTKRYDLAGKASNKIETKNRSLGLKPSGQHAFEEVEQIDELSKSTLGSYLDKKKSEYMKGKTQSGSKENAKDIQNMGKAHDKMKKEEYTLKQMKERMEEPVLNELISEVMSKDASAGDYIHDFIHSDNPKFAGKSDAKRKEMALAAYYSKKNEETVQEGLKDFAKKSFKALTGGSDKDHLDRLKKDMYGGSEVKYAAKTLVKHAKDPLGLKKEETETVEEGWDDMVKDAKDKVKSGPKPSGGSGVKQGTRYGGSKQKEKPEQDVKEATDTVEKDPKTGKVKSWMHTGDWKKDNGKAGRGKVTNMSDKARRRTEKMSEGKDPNMDAGVGSQPNFVTDSAKPMQHAQSLAKKSLAKMRSDMMAKKSK
jgi:hypothetical protein